MDWWGWGGGQQEGLSGWVYSLDKGSECAGVWAYSWNMSIGPEGLVEGS